MITSDSFCLRFPCWSKIGQKAVMASSSSNLPDAQNSASLSPSEARAIFHKNDYYGTTSGFCQGHAQANVMMLPSELADHFEKFCRINHGPFPLLYRSKPGDVGAPPLAKDTDIKWDIPRYCVYSNGCIVEDTLDLDGFSHMWSDIVSFYIGCSFSFENQLIANGIELANLKEGKNCSMFKTNLTAEDVGVFRDVSLVTTMRPVPKSLLKTAVSITAQYPDHHGAPIHIGDPLRIGVTDISQPDQGDQQVSLDEDSVPVFWACGVSTREAVASAKPKLAFSHYPGSMFIADIQPERKELDETIEIVQLSRPSDPYFASVIGSKVASIFTDLELALLEDPGCRGVASLLVKSDLLKAVLSLSHAKRIAITTGFPANTGLPVKEETDGLPGALSICRALLALNKEVTFISDQTNQTIFEKCVDKMVSIGALKSKVPVIPFEKAKKMYLAAPKESPLFDCLLAIERLGQSKDGSCRTMNNVDITSLADPIDELFLLGLSNQLVSTIGIGDGGNELGMGKVREIVAEKIPLGEEIACNTPTDFLISAGISNWAGYAISIGLHAVSQCPLHWRYSHYAINAETPPHFDMSEFLPTDEQSTSLLQYMNDDLGIMDGINQQKGSVDGVPMVDILKKVEEMKKLIH